MKKTNTELATLYIKIASESDNSINLAYNMYRQAEFELLPMIEELKENLAKETGMAIVNFKAYQDKEEKFEQRIISQQQQIQRLKEDNIITDKLATEIMNKSIVLQSKYDKMVEKLKKEMRASYTLQEANNFIQAVEKAIIEQSKDN